MRMRKKEWDEESKINSERSRNLEKKAEKRWRRYLKRKKKKNDRQMMKIKE